jgi:hypothetical protein
MMPLIKDNKHFGALILYKKVERQPPPYPKERENAGPYSSGANVRDSYPKGMECEVDIRLKYL